MKKLIENKKNIIIAFCITLFLIASLAIYASFELFKEKESTGKVDIQQTNVTTKKDDEETSEMTSEHETEQMSETEESESASTTDNIENSNTDIGIDDTTKEHITNKQETTKQETTKQETTKQEQVENETTTSLNEDVVTSKFVHPGVLHTKEAFDYMKYAVDNQISPNIDTWNVLVVTGYSNAYWNPRPLETVIRGGNGDNVAQLYIDVARAYQCALIWKISGSPEHGMAACRILNAWSATLKCVSGNADRYLASGLFGYQLANASEIMREHPDFELEQMQTMLYDVFYKPMNERFLIGNEWGYPHNDAYFQNYWANWDLCNMASAMAIGIFCDKEDAYNVAVDYFKNGIGNGSIYNAVPYIHEDGTAQWQESGRDQGHTNLGIGLMACVCEMAWNQGDDLYGWGDNRFLKAAEYVAKYNNGEDVCFSEYEWGSGRNGAVNYHTVVSGAGRGEVRPIWSMIYNHYVGRMGLEAPNVKSRLESVNWAEYGAVSGGHATTHDQPGWGTLTYIGNTKNKTTVVPKNSVISGKYRIVSVHTGKSLMVSDEGNVRQCVKGADSRDVWEIIDLGDGEYKIVNAETGLVMAVAGDSHGNGALIIGYKDNGKASQRFAILLADPGNYRIIAANSGKALDIPWGDAGENINLQQYRYTCLNFQKWYLEAVE